MHPSFWLWVTPFGNSAIILPFAGLVGLCLLLRPATRKYGCWWFAMLAVECALVGGTKIAYMSWGWVPGRLNFIGLSGDTAMAFVFWPAVAAWLFAKYGSRARLLALAVAVGLATLVAVSRVVTHAHSVSEVVSGGIFGAVLVCVFLFVTRREPPGLPVLARWLPVAALVALLLATAATPRPIDYNSMFAQTARLVAGHKTIYKRCDLGPWAALTKARRSCVPHGPETVD